MVTARLVLRSWTPSELAAVATAGDAGQGPFRPAHWAEDFPAEGDIVIARFLAEHAEGGRNAFGHRLVIERESGLLVGSAGLFRSPAEGTAEIGYGIVPSRRGRGYASEAARALLEHALAWPHVHTVSAEVEVANPASVRVLEKAGLRRRSVSEDGTRAHYRTSGPEGR
nr:GNAT family N-acetyltransferase [Streptomyces albus]